MTRKPKPKRKRAPKRLTREHIIDVMQEVIAVREATWRNELEAVEMRLMGMIGQLMNEVHAARVGALSKRLADLENQAKETP